MSASSERELSKVLNKNSSANPDDNTSWPDAVYLPFTRLAYLLRYAKHYLHYKAWDH